MFRKKEKKKKKKIRSSQRASSSRHPPIAQIASKTATTYRDCETRVMQATERRDNDKPERKVTVSRGQEIFREAEERGGSR